VTVLIVFSRQTSEFSPGLPARAGQNPEVWIRPSTGMKGAPACTPWAKQW